MSLDMLLLHDPFDAEVQATPGEDPAEGLLEPSLGLYLREIGRYPLLTAEEEVQLALAREAGEAAAAEPEQLPPDHPRRPELEARAKTGEAVRRRLIESNLRLVVTVARKYRGLGLPLLDLIQEGNIGLERAVQKYDPRTGYRFSTCAYWWIRQAVSRALADQAHVIRLPIHVVERLSAIAKAQHELEQETGAPAQPEQIATRLDLPVRHVREALSAARPALSLEQPPHPLVDEELTMDSLLADPDAPAPESAAARTVLVTEVERVLQSLTPREQVVLKLRFGLGQADGGQIPAPTLRQIGGELGMTQEGVRKIEANALQKLRTMPVVQRLKEYLD